MTADEMIDNIIKVFDLAKEVKKGETKEFNCPICNNKITIAKSAYNGHIWAKCETEKCIHIIQ